VSAAPLYRRLLGSRFNELAPALRRLHDVTGSMTAQGRAEVTVGKGLLAQIVLILFGLPPAGACDIAISFTPDKEREIWQRSFGGHELSSVEYLRQGASGPLLVERIGAVTVAQKPLVEKGCLRLVIQSWRFCGVPMPLRLAPCSDVLEYECEGRFHFDVALSHPWIGLIVRYRGWLA
jgi:hypothetical protein